MASVKKTNNTKRTYHDLRSLARRTQSTKRRRGRTSSRLTKASPATLRKQTSTFSSRVNNRPVPTFVSATGTVSPSLTGGAFHTARKYDNRAALPFLVYVCLYIAFIPEARRSPGCKTVLFFSFSRRRHVQVALARPALARFKR